MELYPILFITPPTQHNHSSSSSSFFSYSKINTIKYKDGTRERRRLTLLAQSKTPQHVAAQAEAVAARKAKHVAAAPWSQQTRDKEKRLERRGTRALRKTAILKAKAEGVYVHTAKQKNSNNTLDASGAGDDDGDDWDDLQKEARSLKKARKVLGGRKKEVFSSCSEDSD